MPFYVKIVVKVLLGSPDGKRSVPNAEALSHLTVAEDDSHHRWHVSGRHDRRFPGSGPLWLNFKRKAGSIVLLNKFGHEWAELENFPDSPTINSKGTAYTYNLIYPPCKYTPNGKWYGDWWINQKAKQNLPLFDPNAGIIQNALAMCTQDTGWRYDTSSGGGFAIGAGWGGGGQHLNLVLKRKEASDTRRWDLTINAAGIGVMTPGVSVSGSTESAPSTALTALHTGPGGKIPFPVGDLAGTVLFFDAGAGVGVGKGKVGAGVGGSITTFLFVGGFYNDGMMPALASVKAVLQIASTSGGGGKSGGVVSAGAQGLVYAGRCSLKQRA